MLVGLDLDGTIVIYDDLFHRLARDRLGMPPGIPIRKAAVRDWVRRLPAGEPQWIALQALAYGPLMQEAPAAEGVETFLHGCAAADVDVAVISHRTRASVADPSIDLHACATDWLEERGFRLDGVYLEPTRTAKLARIESEACALFIDDLEDVLLESTFPPSTERWLYTPIDVDRIAEGLHVFADWDDPLRRVLEMREAAADAR